MSKVISNLRFLELSIACDDVLHSLSFFQELGFHTIDTNDIWDYPYVVISDGRCSIGLHQKENFDLISPITRFAFAHNDVALVQREMLDQDHQITYSDLDSDDIIQNTLFTAPSGVGAHILAARPFSPLSQPQESVLGYFRSYLVPHGKNGQSLSFWEHLGLLVTEDKEHGVHISTTEFNAVLAEFDFAQPALIFEHQDPESIFPHLARFGVAISMPETGLPMDGVFSIKTPQGIDLIVRKEN